MTGNSTQDAPAFGEATLSNCEREQIHLPGSIQPHGALLVVDPGDLTVLQASANAGVMLGFAREPAGARLQDLNDRLAKAVDLLIRGARTHAGRSDPSVQVLHSRLGTPPRAFDILQHDVGPAGVVLEFEPSAPFADLSDFCENAFEGVLNAMTLSALCDTTAATFKNLTGFDRVMVYQFDEEGHGAVVSERRESDLEAYLGNRYPASDIPNIARRLYLHNRLRVIADLDYEPVPVEPTASPLTNAPLDMSHCGLRSVSPIHVQYLKNMGVSATLVVSLVVGGRLWGLVSCHHYKPRTVPFETRVACELIAESVATRISALESFARAEAELAVRRIEQRIIESIAREGDWRTGITDNARALMQPTNAAGVALAFEGNIVASGDVPSTEQIWTLVRWLDEHSPTRLFETAALTLERPEFASMKSMASGVISVPVSRSGGEYLMWFRPERVKTVTWGGNPFKQESDEKDLGVLSPRRSFSKWHQLVKGTADAWTANDIAAARLIGESIEDVVYQFRAVRMLIVQDQLARVSRDVRNAQQPVIVTDAAGKVLLVNDAFYRLLPAQHENLISADDLPSVFRSPSKIKSLLQVLFRDQQPWRGEVSIEADTSGLRTLMLRADPVFGDAQRVLGYVLFFTDVTDRKNVEVARRRFQESIVEAHRDRGPRLDSKSGLAYRNLMTSAVSNAKLAALEISDSLDLESVPGMLDSVYHSVDRSRRLLSQLLIRQADEEEEE